MQMRHSVLHKSHHIAGTQAREGDGALAKMVLEKIPDERHVVDDRRCGQTTCFTQILRIVLDTALNCGQSGGLDLLLGNHALTAQKGNEVLQLRRITATRSQMPGAIT